MPRSKLAEAAKRKVPPVDWLWAIVLERKSAYGYDLKQMAKAAGVSYNTMRKYINISPWEWGPKARNRICAEFQIDCGSVARIGELSKEVITQ